MILPQEVFLQAHDLAENMKIYSLQKKWIWFENVLQFFHSFSIASPTCWTLCFSKSFLMRQQAIIFCGSFDDIRYDRLRPLYHPII